MTRAWLGVSQYTSRLVLRVEILLRRNTGAALVPDSATDYQTICMGCLDPEIFSMESISFFTHVLCGSGSGMTPCWAESSQ